VLGLGLGLGLGLDLKRIAFHSYYIDIPPESTSNKHPRYDISIKVCIIKTRCYNLFNT
jgi:hypothetical protein